MLTHKLSYIVVLGPYFDYWGSLLGPYFTKKMGPYLKAWGSLLVLEAVNYHHHYDPHHNNHHLHHHDLDRHPLHNVVGIDAAFVQKPPHTT